MLTIEEVKRLDIQNAPLNPSVKGVVLRLSEIELPQHEKFKAKFYAIIADNTGAISVTVYDVKQREKFIKGMAVVLMNVLLKENYVAVTSKTEVAIAKGYDIPDDIKKAAPKMPSECNDVTIGAALASPVKTIVTVKGKVVNLSPATTKSVEGNLVPFQELVLKDTQHKTTVAIWEDMVDTVHKGQILQLTKCKVRLFNDEKRLTTTRGSLCEKYSHDDSLKDISSEDDDDEENISTSGGKLQNGVLSAVYEVDPYLSCPYPGCNNKKLSTIKCDEQYKMFCSTCKVSYSASSCNHYIRVTMLFETSVQGASAFPTAVKVTLFKPELDKLLTANGISTQANYDKQEIMQTIVNILPVDIRCTLLNNTVKNIVCKRIASDSN